MSEASPEVWPVYKGASFNLWEPDTGVYYDSVDGEDIAAYLHGKRRSQSRTSSSAFSELSETVLDDPCSLPCRRARIAFRDVTRATDTRTLISALVPPDRVIVNQAPYLLQTAGSIRDEAYVLGVLCSMPCDWQARRTVELHMTFEQLNLLSIPDPGAGHPVRDRVTDLAACLAARDKRFSSWAAEVGVAVGTAVDDIAARGGVSLSCCQVFLGGLGQ
ncbi:MAG: hypothetical protein OXL98_05940, partial [Acidimicrobiaceae bacterium]|nr:hypothetical protein [Acidimicrobiaceae bacterium]